MRGFCCHDPHKRITKCQVSHLERSGIMKNTGIPLCPRVTLNTPQYEARSGFKPLFKCVHVDVNTRCFFLFVCVTRSRSKADYAAYDQIFSRRITVCRTHLFLFQKHCPLSANMICHILGRHHRLSMHLPQATCPIHHAAQLTAEQKVMVQARYESSHSINKQPLFNSPA